MATRTQFSDLVFHVETDGTVTALVDVQVNVYLPGTTTAATIYSSRTGGSAKANPFLTVSGAPGVVEFWAEEGDYDVKFSDTITPNRIGVKTIGWQAARVPQPGDMRVAAKNEADSAGWLVADGRAVSRSTYSALFSAIGSAFGAGNGSTTFNIPDTRGRCVFGSGAGPGLSAWGVGDYAGAEHITTGELPAHSHTATASVSDPGHQHGVVLQTSGGGEEGWDVSSSFGNTLHSVRPSGIAATGFTGISVGVSVQNSGGAGAYWQPSVGMKMMVKI